MGKTESDALTIMQEQMIKQGEQMRKFKESLYANIVNNCAIATDPIMATQHHSDDTIRYYDEQWKYNRLVPESAIELVDEMF